MLALSDNSQISMEQKRCCDYYYIHVHIQGTIKHKFTHTNIKQKSNYRRMDGSKNALQEFRPF